MQGLPGFDRARQPAPPVPGLIEARARWKETIRQDPQQLNAQAQRHDAWDQLQAALERDITGPLIDAARASSSGSQRTQLLMATDLFKRLFEQGLLLDAEVDARARDFNPSIHGAALPQAGLEQWLRLGHELAQIAERLEASEGSSTGTIECEPTEHRRLPDSSNLD